MRLQLSLSFYTRVILFLKLKVSKFVSGPLVSVLDMFCPDATADELLFARFNILLF